MLTALVDGFPGQAETGPFEYLREAVRPKPRAHFGDLTAVTGSRVFSAKAANPHLPPFSQVAAVDWLGDSILLMPHNGAHLDVCNFDGSQPGAPLENNTEPDVEDIPLPPVASLLAADGGRPHTKVMATGWREWLQNLESKTVWFKSDSFAELSAAIDRVQSLVVDQPMRATRKDGRTVVGEVRGGESEFRVGGPAFPANELIALPALRVTFVRPTAQAAGQAANPARAARSGAKYGRKFLNRAFVNSFADPEHDRAQKLARRTVGGMGLGALVTKRDSVRFDLVAGA